jgi:hypothetical protein
MAKAKNLAGLAALGALGYMLTRDKTSENAGDQKTSSYTRDTKRVEAEDFKPSNESSYTPGSTGTARPGVGDATNDLLPKKIKSLAAADEDTKTTTPSKTKVPGGEPKRTEGSKPMPSLRKVEARAASNRTDAMRNVSRANVAAANKMKRMAANPEAQAVESVYPEEYVVGGPGLKAVGAAAKNLANRGSQKLAEYSTPLLRGPAAEATAPRLGAPAKQLTGPSKADLVARDRAARAAAREESMRAENAANYGLNPEAPGYGASASALRDKLGGADFSLGMKRGGAVKAKRMASGGMTSKGSSASRRGDGIASRGKTRGKLY